MPFSMGHNSFKSKPVFTSSAGELERSAHDPPCWISPADTRSGRLLFLLCAFLLTRPAFIFHEYAPVFILHLLWLGSSRAFITCLAFSTGVLIYTKLSLCTVSFWINAFFFFFQMFASKFVCHYRHRKLIQRRYSEQNCTCI